MQHIALALALLCLPEAMALAATAENRTDGSLSADAAGGWIRVRGPESVLPTGWRRTEQGWELADSWPRSTAAGSAEVINRLIRSQHQIESQQGWVRVLANGMQCVRRLDPITLFATQVTMIALLACLVSRTDESSNTEPKPA